MSRLTLRLVLAQSADALTFAAFYLAIGAGTHSERNPLILGLMAFGGVQLVVLAKVVVAGVIGWRHDHRRARPMSPRFAVALTIAMSVATASGIAGAGFNSAAIVSASLSRPAGEPQPAPRVGEGHEGAAVAPDAPRRTPATWPGLHSLTIVDERDAARVGDGAPDRHSLRGYASWVRADLGPRYLAMRLKRGTHVRICGPVGCVRRTVNDYGPSARIRPRRIADLSARDFGLVCGPTSMGVCRVRATVLGGIALPATDTP